LIGADERKGVAHDAPTAAALEHQRCDGRVVFLLHRVGCWRDTDSVERPSCIFLPLHLLRRVHIQLRPNAQDWRQPPFVSILFANFSCDFETESKKYDLFLGNKGSINYKNFCALGKGLLDERSSCVGELQLKEE
jgi:hypothetical protein